MKFFIVASGVNCKDFAVECYRSLQGLTTYNWKATLIDDASTDGTYEALMAIDYDSRVTVKKNQVNMGAAYNRLMAIKEANLDPEDVIIFLGLDDKLYAGALKVIQKKYDEGVWMTYGNWQNQQGRVCTVDLEFDEETHRTRDYRKVKYRSTAPNTFKKFLFDQIPEEDFKLEGDWIRVCTEAEVMFSCLEMSGKSKIGIIHDVIYYYREGLKMGTLKKFGREEKYRIYDLIAARNKRPAMIKVGNTVCVLHQGNIEANIL